MASEVHFDFKAYINTAKHLFEETSRVSGLDRQVSTSRVSGHIRQESPDGIDPSTQGRALPVSPPVSKLLSSLTLVVQGSAAKADLAERLDDLKLSIYDLSKRQYDDLIDEPTSAVEDVKMLLDEMRNALKCMETVVLLEAAMSQSQLL